MSRFDPSYYVCERCGSPSLLGQTCASCTKDQRIAALEAELYPAYRALGMEPQPETLPEGTTYRPAKDLAEEIQRMADELTEERALMDWVFKNAIIQVTGEGWGTRKNRLGDRAAIDTARKLEN